MIGYGLTVQMSRRHSQRRVVFIFIYPKFPGLPLEAYHKHHAKPETVFELNETLQVIWDSTLQGPSETGCQGVSKWDFVDII